MYESVIIGNCMNMITRRDTVHALLPSNTRACLRIAHAASVSGEGEGTVTLRVGQQFRGLGLCPSSPFDSFGESSIWIVIRLLHNDNCR